MAMMKGFPRAILLGSLVVFLTPLITGVMPAALAITLVAGLTVAGALSAGLAVLGAEAILGWLKM